MNTFRAVRLLSTSRPVFKASHYKQNANAERPYKKLKNENIPHEKLHLVDESGSLVAVTKTALLKRHKAGIESKQEYIELLQEHPQAIVRIVNIEEEAAKKREFKEQRKVKRREQAASRNTNEHKEVQLTWASSPADIEHKLERVRELLADGARVDLVFAPKSGVPRLSKDDASARLDSVVQQLADTGAKEWRDRNFHRGIAVVFLQPQ